MLQIILTLAIFLILVIPMGKYMYHIATEQKTFADKVFNPIDHLIYKICGIKNEDMGWKKYALTLVTANAVMVFVGYLILRIQNLLFLNPNGIEGMESSLSFNTIISFMTNTNLQHYSGESGLSYAAQMCVIIFMMFTSAASGYAACMAFCRGLSGRKLGNFYRDMVRITTRILIPVSFIVLSYAAQMCVIIFMMFTSAASGYAACMAFCRGLSGRKLGNFYRDMVRITTRILIPVSFIVGLILVSQGTPQTLMQNFTVETIEGKYQDFAMGPVAALESIKHLGTNGGGFFGANSTTPFENPTFTVETIEGKYQDFAMGPVAALESIKHLGTNGGGFFGANSTTPFENPTVISNIVELLSMMILPGACIVTFGHMLHDRKKNKVKAAAVAVAPAKKKILMGRQGAVVFGAMAVIFMSRGSGACKEKNPYGTSGRCSVWRNGSHLYDRTSVMLQLRDGRKSRDR